MPFTPSRSEDLTGVDDRWYGGRVDVLQAKPSTGVPVTGESRAPVRGVGGVGGVGGADGATREGSGTWSASFPVQVFVLLMSANAPLAAFSTRGSDSWTGWANLIATVSVATCVALVVADRRFLLGVARVNWPFTALVGWLAMTSMWSILPAASANWIGSKFPYFAAYVVICGKTTFERRLAILHASILAAYAAGWLGSLRYPSFDRFGTEYSGSYMHNNIAAHAAVLGVASGAFYLLLKPRRALLVLPGIGFCLWAGEASQSNTPRSVLFIAFAVATAVFAAGIVARKFRAHGRSPRFTALVVAGLVAAGAVAARVLVAMVFRNSEGVVDLTLTRRTGIWKACIAVIRRAPFTGYGSGATVFSSSLRNEIEFRTGYVAVHSHNGVLDAALMGGLPAVAMLFTTVVQALRRIGRSFVNRPPLAAARAGILATVLGLNMTEQDFFQGLLPTLFLLLAIACPARPFRPHTLRPSSTRDRPDSPPDRSSADVSI